MKITKLFFYLFVIYFSTLPFGMAATQATTDLDTLKSLEGSWTGAPTTMEGKEITPKVIYKTTSGGSAVEEILFPGSPKEMLSVYTQDPHMGALIITLKDKNHLQQEWIFTGPDGKQEAHVFSYVRDK